MTIFTPTIPTMPAQLPGQSVNSLYQNKSHIFLSFREFGGQQAGIFAFYPRERIISIMYACMVPFIGFATFQAVLYLRAVVTAMSKVFDVMFEQPSAIGGRVTSLEQSLETGFLPANGVDLLE